MVSKEKIKNKIIDFNNFILCLPAFYIGIGLSSILWRIKSLIKEGGKGDWRNSKGQGSLEELKKMY